MLAEEVPEDVFAVLRPGVGSVPSTDDQLGYALQSWEETPAHLSTICSIGTNKEPKREAAPFGGLLPIASHLYAYRRGPDP